ncbi:MAG TPA: hypothetical protein VNN07_14985 [Candidatus Tectomicrobia bacterium]|nr:hypothetical protein [Candidatus Tectomicrobia bacterium]
MRLLPLVAALAVLAAPGVVAAQRQDCAALPTSAPKARACNPRQECLAKAAHLAGPAQERARRDCERMPTSGTCYGPDTYNPQAECRERQRR